MDRADDTQLTMRRTINAPVERVFRAWIDPEALRRWFAVDESHQCVLAEVDVRVGGRYRLAVRAPDGAEHRVSGVYQEIVPDRKLVFSWAWEGTPERESLVTVELRSLDQGTDLLLTHRRFFDREARDKHAHGWSGCLDGLLRLFADNAKQPIGGRP